MAVRDEGPEQAEANQGRNGRMSWWDALGNLPAVLVVAGLLLYGYLSICYDQFYSRLGVDPNDVGLGYAGILARSSGFVVVFLALTYLVTGAFVFFRMFGYQGSGRPRRGALLRLLGGLYLLGVLAWTPFAAAWSADDVRAGRPVGPVRMPYPYHRFPFSLYMRTRSLLSQPER